MAWAEINKKSWKTDQTRWKYHVEPFLKNKMMDKVTALDIETILDKMRSSDNRLGRPYLPQTVKHTLILQKRVFNWAIRFHDLRHTYASYLASSGKVDIYTLKELLGHSTIEMTLRCAHLVNGALKRAIEVADEVF